MTVTVTQLITYPLKSGQALPHEYVEVQPLGLEGDRLWMVIDAQTGMFITQRPQPGHEPKLALVTAIENENTGLWLQAPGVPTLKVGNPNRSFKPTEREITLFDNTLPALDTGEEAASWMSVYLGRDVRLVRFKDEFIRYVDPAYARAYDRTGFSDGFPILITSEESLTALNVTAGMDRFRPNIVLKGLEAFEEDSIRTLRIGDVFLELQKPCTRCPMPSVNQATGEQEKATSPLPALAKLRKGEGDGLKGVFFGVNASPTSMGALRTGMEAEILTRHDLHPAIASTVMRYRA